MSWPATRQTSAATPEHASLPAAQAPPGERGEERAVGDPVAGGVEDRAERRAVTPRARAIAPSTQVEEHEDGDDERAEEQLPARQEPDGRGDGADGAGDRDGVRARRRGPTSQPPDRVGDAVDVRRAKTLSIDSCLVVPGPAVASAACSRIAPARQACALLPRRLPGSGLGGQQRACLGEQLRDHLGLADDRDEVGVAAPARHDVLVQVVGQRAAGDGAQVDARR